MPKDKPVTVLCTYRPKPGKEKELFDLVKKHWPALHKAGLATNEPAQIYRATEKSSGKVYFVEIYSWKDEKSPQVAHESPEVMKIWEPMGPIIDGGPSPHWAVVERVSAKS
jgi:quinol monooxygenase YgiN